jgi:hypothetical protein
MTGGLYWLRDMVHRRKKEGCVVRKYKKQGCHHCQFLTLFFVLSGGGSKNTFEKSFRAAPACKA